jgi:hypothetical protein
MTDILSQTLSGTEALQTGSPTVTLVTNRNGTASNFAEDCECMRTSNASFRVSVVAVALAATVACSRTDQTTRERTAEPAATEQQFASVRFVDAHHGDAALYFGNQQVFSGTTDKVTDYKQLPAERSQFALRAPGHAEGDALATNSEGLDAGKHYTVVAFDDKGGGASLRVLNDDEDAPDAGKAKVRLINASPEMEGLELHAAGKRDEIASQTRFTTGSTWQEVDPVTGPLELRATDRKPVRIANVTLEPGKLYTFVVRPGKTPKASPEVTPIVDTPRS